ncbi:hypothetical protein GCM10025331_78170 [Actinoplanes utahensis]|nr:hypothetical protein Aut01nite_81010 [Actinoplanes utahensis]
MSIGGNPGEKGRYGGAMVAMAREGYAGRMLRQKTGGRPKWTPAVRTGVARHFMI